MEEESILTTTKSAIGDETTTAFDNELKLHINAALIVLNQNGVGRNAYVKDANNLWGEFKDPAQVHGNESFNLVPLFVFAKTKILFDPPPPSNVAVFQAYIDELLWRLRTAYEEDNIVLR